MFWDIFWGQLAAGMVAFVVAGAAFLAWKEIQWRRFATARAAALKLFAEGQHERIDPDAAESLKRTRRDE